MSWFTDLKVILGVESGEFQIGAPAGSTNTSLTATLLA